MKLSVSLPDEDVVVLDEHARKAGLGSRSAAIHQAVRLLQQSGLEADYEAAWQEWHRSGERQIWEAVAGDGLP
ncbi:MAG: ribbon-helix-helix domain-containing protein [Pseudonocardiaceae bacterium]